MSVNILCNQTNMSKLYSCIVFSLSLIYLSIAANCSWVQPVTNFTSDKFEDISQTWDIVQGKDYRNFRKILLNISKNIPWSGDCLYSTTNCFFVSNNDTDCYGNSPGCNECLYSVGLVNCIF